MARTRGADTVGEGSSGVERQRPVASIRRRNHCEALDIDLVS